MNICDCMEWENVKSSLSSKIIKPSKCQCVEEYNIKEQVGSTLTKKFKGLVSLDMDDGITSIMYEIKSSCQWWKVPHGWGLKIAILTYCEFS